MKKFKYHRDRRSKRITTVAMILLTVGVTAFHFIHGGDYLPAWFLAILLCIIAFCILSIPLSIRIDKDVFEIHCIVELTRIHMEDIELIRRIDSEEFRKLYPLFASYGFWGYFGYYFNFREWNIYKVYATKRKNLVLIEDIYEDTFIVSCDDADEMIRLVIEARNRKREEIYRHTKNTVTDI